MNLIAWSILIAWLSQPGEEAVGSQCLLLYEVDFLVSSWVEGVGILGVYGDLC